ncbi:MAG: extracellular solute-binding protein [Novosphingobium sp.]|nr:extracellular solute-binding protein [Novosphingobium sp.]
MTTISRRSVLKGAGAGVAAAALTGIVPKAATTQARPFTWAATGGTWGDTLNKVFIEPFAKANGLEVVHSAQLESVALSKALASCGNPPFEVTNGPQADMDLLNDSGCVEAYDPSIVTSLGDIYPEAKQGDFYAALNILLFGMTWNTKEATKPTSYSDLLLDKYKNKVAIPAYGWYGMPWLHALNKELGGTEDDITPGIEAAAEMVKKNGAILIENADHGTRVMESGEVVIMPYWNGRTARLQEAGVSAAFELVPGTVSVGTGYSILKGSPYAEQSQKLVEMTLDPARQLEFTMWSKYPPSNKNAVLPPELEGIKIPEGGLEKAAKLDWKKVNDYRSEYLERWNKEVLNI